VIIVKNVLLLDQVVFSYFVLHRSMIPVVLTNKVTHLTRFDIFVVWRVGDPGVPTE